MLLFLPPLIDSKIKYLPLLIFKQNLLVHDRHSYAYFSYKSSVWNFTKKSARSDRIVYREKIDLLMKILVLKCLYLLID